MHLESDYTGKLKQLREPVFRKLEFAGKENDQVSEEKLQYYLEYYRIRESQHVKKANSKKIKDVIKLYEYLKEVAFANCGRITLDVDEKKLKASIVYWGSYLFITKEENDFIRDILLQLNGKYSLIYIEPSDGGIQINIKENLFDEVMVRDEKEKLEEVRNKIKQPKE